jgi:hypothetical protein
MAEPGKPEAPKDLEEAQDKVAKLQTLGWEAGAGATVWARAVSDELERHETARESYGSDANQEAWERLHSTALLVALAIHQVLEAESRVRSVTGDAELARARARFDAIGPRAEALRDLVSHLADYAVGMGHRQTARAEPPITEPYVETFIHWSNGGGTILDLGGERLNLRTVANAAVERAAVVERVRQTYLTRSERAANAALRRLRDRLDP